MTLTFYAGKTPSTKKELYKLAWIALIYSLVFNALVVANRIGGTFGIFKPFYNSVDNRGYYLFNCEKIRI